MVVPVSVINGWFNGGRVNGLFQCVRLNSSLHHSPLMPDRSHSNPHYFIDTELGFSCYFSLRLLLLFLIVEVLSLLLIEKINDCSAFILFLLFVEIYGEFLRFLFHPNTGVSSCEKHGYDDYSSDSLIVLTCTQILL